MDKPHSVILAERALWIWGAWIFLYGLYTAFVPSPDINQALGELQGMITITPEELRTASIATYAIVAASVVGLAFAVAARQKWARFMVVVGFALQVMWDVGQIGQPALRFLTDVPDVLLQLYALRQLYTPDARAWYREMHARAL